MASLNLCLTSSQRNHFAFRQNVSVAKAISVCTEIDFFQKYQTGHLKGGLNVY